MNIRRGVLGLVAILVVGTVGVWVYWRSDGSAPGVLRLTGSVEVTDVDLSFEVPGTLARRSVSEGDRVRDGDTLARLDTRSYRRRVERAQAQHEQARAKLRELTAGFRREEIQQARARVEQFQAETRYWQAERDRTRRLFRRDLFPRSDFERTTKNFRTARARLREARHRLQLLRSGPRSEKVEQARARLEETRAALALARKELHDAHMESPLTGRVLSDNVDTGEYVPPGVPVLTVADLRDVWVRAYVNGRDLGRVKRGQAATIHTDSFPDRSYRGTISFISDEAEFTPRPVETREQRVKKVYRVKVDVRNPRRELKPGMPVDVRVRPGDEGNFSRGDR